MPWPRKEQVEATRNQYPKGTRVELIEMVDDPYTDLKPGDRGRVTHVDDTGSVHIAWDNGSSLAALYGIDRIKVVPAVTDEIRQQILAIRDTGKVNVFDTIGVQRLAFEMEFYELVALIAEDPKAYLDFLLNRKAERISATHL